ncbi:hypothetical protein QBC33DRAFT_556768 [Phialemonium atrogriseum]|uniref:C2H2-type domain-containing protein n=1 Tax=Phialemonium atrogriseum TaxID=1093897 RepID=A0AAJ0C5P8_9PEZI|nr:uncharacterized protein QBC33DRAFT_556768 [Phialemonium atrogriseum]KAK1769473.1 hypothetical protein QBC33DRAFT_556768 [Phialemonium atrogriseum]
MHARDASGRRVSLLNDDSQHESMPRRISYRAASHIISQPYPPISTKSSSSSPNTPQLLRSDSYDSQMSNESITPLTPIYDYTMMYAAGQDAHSPFEEYMVDPSSYAAAGARRPSALSNSRSSSYEDDTGLNPSAAKATSERSGKRYPCRYRDTHGCEKTFTTSGHASRHSKIHTAEKAVPCTHPGCTKKFTRADNMKQHLETHYKDKARSSSSRSSLSSSERRSSASGKSSSSSRKAAAAAAHAQQNPPLPSPGDAWDMRGLNIPLLGSRQSVSSTPSSGLDALAMAVACQEGA